MDKIDRRTFLVGTATLGASVVAGGMLAGCAAQSDKPNVASHLGEVDSWLDGLGL